MRPPAYRKEFMHYLEIISFIFLGSILFYLNLLRQRLCFLEKETRDVLQSIGLVQDYCFHFEDRFNDLKKCIKK